MASRRYWCQTGLQIFACGSITGDRRLLGTGNREPGTEALYRDDGDSSTRCRSLGMTRVFCRLPPAACRLPPAARRPPPAARRRQSPVAPLP